MSSSTKEALSTALKKMLGVKPIDKVTVKDLVGICNVNRQTFYYHFNDVYDLLAWTFEEDADKYLPSKVIYDNWREDVMTYFRYLKNNRVVALNIFNSPRRKFMLQHIKDRLHSCVRDFALIVSEGKNIDMQDFEFVVDLYTNLVVGLISQWMDSGMPESLPGNRERIMSLLDNSIEVMLGSFQRPGKIAAQS